ncbi:unnamed protein product [Ilex paraguariensis]|uniref:Secoisolariciresinol dehydrogenase n=1 Tax=Ilex paraguariensis TaxID=185542 RepID=A0ABC8UHR9_9AQUA
MTKGSSSLTPIVKRLQGKVAVITGGASGIGETTARLFARHGAKMTSAITCKEIGSDESISFVHCDVTRELDVQRAVDTAIAKHGKLDTMFKNAGISGNMDPRIQSLGRDDFRKVFDVNVFGGFLGAKHAARVMIPAKRGSILFTSSIVSVCSAEVPHVYTASKHAVVGLTKNLCVELGKYGIRVNCIPPFLVPTPMMRNLLGMMDEKAAQEVVSESANLKEVMLGTEDVAEAAVYLGSDESKYVTGLNLVVDGGYHTTNPTIGNALKNMFS